LRVARRLLMLRAMTKKAIWMAALAIAAVPACKKQEGSTGGSAAKATEGGGDLPDDIAKWMPANASQLLSGVWETRISFYEAKSMDIAAALEITGDKARASDGQKDHTLGFAIETPCSFALTESAGGGKVTYTKFFLVQAGKLAAVGDGAGGYRKGKEAIACMIGGDSLVTSDAAGACKSWKRDFMDKTWTSKPVDCAWASKDGKDTLRIGKPDDAFSHSLVADGDLLWSEQLRDETTKQRYMKHAADFAAAKTWADGERKAKDPGEQAKAAGGKVGDTSPIAP
jgi:hypothetical protein